VITQWSQYRFTPKRLYTTSWKTTTGKERASAVIQKIASL